MKKCTQKDLCTCRDNICAYICTTYETLCTNIRVFKDANQLLLHSEKEGATCQNNTKSVTSHKSSYQAHVGNNTLKKEEMHKRCASNKALDESASADEESGRYEPENV